MAEATQVHTNGKSHINKVEAKAETLTDRLPEMVKNTQDRVANTVEQVASVATDKASQAAHWLRERSDDAFEKSDVALNSTRDFVRKYPVRTLVAGLAVGAVVGWIFSSRGRSNA